MKTLKYRCYMLTMFPVNDIMEAAVFCKTLNLSDRPAVQTAESQLTKVSINISAESIAINFIILTFLSWI